MISIQQLDRLKREAKANAFAALSVAKDAELALENYDYSRSRGFDPTERQRLLDEFNEADYMAESRSYLLQLIQDAEDSR
jgi:hypothetical protein